MDTIVLPPGILEPARRQLGVPDCVLNVLMPGQDLQGASVVALVGERLAAGVPVHVRVRLERNFGRATARIRVSWAPAQSAAIISLGRSREFSTWRSLAGVEGKAAT
jgi:hypothetical protein